MSRSLPYLTALVVAIHWMAGANAAHAGFVTVSVTPDTEHVTLINSLPDSASMTPRQSEDRGRNLPEAHDVPLPGLPVLQEAAGSMSASPTSGTAAAPATAVATPSVPSPADLQIRMASMEEPFHPRFIKSRLFRPPRELG